MTFTTATVAKVEQSKLQFQGAFNEMWSVSLNVDPSSIAAGLEDTATFTIPGLALGDAVVTWAAGANITVDAGVSVFVSAANTLTIVITNVNAVTALDIAPSVWKVMLGRPNW